MLAAIKIFINSNVLLFYMKKQILILAASFLLLVLISMPAGATIRKTGSQGDYFPIKLEIDGVVVGSFKEISGIESETEIIDIKDGVMLISLKNGFISDPAFTDWVKETMEVCQQAGDEREKEPSKNLKGEGKQANKDNEEELAEAGPPIGHVDHGKGSVRERGGYITICDPESIPAALERKSISIIVLDRAGQEAKSKIYGVEPAMSYVIYGAVPIRWKGPALDAKGDTHTVEELELAAEKIDRKILAETIPLTLIFNLADGDVKAEINPESIQVIFDPNKNASAKAKPWKHHNIQGLDSPTLEFTSGEPYRLQMELFFDTYEEGKSVRELTDKIEKLALVNAEKHRPPTILLNFVGSTYEGVLESAQTRFTLFKDDGTPVVAVMNTVWKEFSLDMKSSIDKDELPPFALCRFYSWCWEKASGGSCCKTVAVCDDGVVSWVQCVDSGSLS